MHPQLQQGILDTYHQGPRQQTMGGSACSCVPLGEVIRAVHEFTFRLVVKHADATTASTGHFGHLSPRIKAADHEWQCPQLCTLAEVIPAVLSCRAGMLLPCGSASESGDLPFNRSPVWGLEEPSLSATEVWPLRRFSTWESEVPWGRVPVELPSGPLPA